MVVKFLGSMILSIGGAFAISNIEQIKTKIELKQIIAILLLSFCTFFFIKVEFSVLQSILIFIVMILAYKTIFDFTLAKSIIMTGIIMILSAIGDSTIVMLTMNFIPKSTYHSNYLLLIGCNLYIGFFMYLVTKIPLFSQKLRRIINKTSGNKKIYITIEILLMIALLSLVTYNVYNNFTFNIQYIIDILIYALIGLVLAVYIKEFTTNIKLLEDYDKLVEYVENFEEWIEDEQLELHESKNRLSAIYEMDNIDEIKKEVSDMLNSKTAIEDSWVTSLKPIPKGGIKGLLYYKFMIAKNNNINLITDVSNKVTSKFKNLSKENQKILFKLIGIYFDNAIEASKESKEKNVSFEVYKIKNELNIVITNTYKNIININNIGKKGISSKGKNRGKGTYLAKKLVNKSNSFEIKNSILNNYYVQKIIVK